MTIRLTRPLIELWQNNHLINSVTQILNEIINDNQSEISLDDVIEKQKRLIFSSSAAPNITLYGYIERILKYSKIQESTIVLSLIYIDTICEKNNLLLTNYNIHRIVFTSILVAIKYNEDEYYSNSYYAKVAGLSIDEINNLEYVFLNLLDYRLFVHNENYVKYLEYLKRYRVKNM